MGWASSSFAIAAVVLAVGGAFKLGDRTVTRRTLTGLGVPGAGPLSVLAGPAELGLGAGAAVLGSPPAAAAVALAFALFAVLVARQLRRGEAVSCGCFGRLSAPPTPVHLAADVFLALSAATAAALGDAPGLVSPGRALGETVATAAVVALAAALVVAVLTVLPAALVAARPGGGAGGPAVRRFHLEGTTP
jgi:hypothetical protein